MGNHTDIKLILRWIYNADIERLGELQQKQFLLEKELFKIEDTYLQAVKTCQQLQQKQPTISNITEEWGVFLVSPKGMHHKFQSNKALP